MCAAERIELDSGWTMRSRERQETVPDSVPGDVYSLSSTWDIR